MKVLQAETALVGVMRELSDIQRQREALEKKRESLEEEKKARLLDYDVQVDKLSLLSWKICGTSRPLVVD